MNQGNKNKPVAFITGASAGIGYELALEFAKCGFDIAAFARRKDRLEMLATEVADRGAKCLVLVGDVRKQEDLKEALRQAAETLIGIDCIVANAGFGVAGNVDRLSPDDFQRQFDTNVFGVLNTAQCGLPYLKLSQGTLAIVGSVSAYVSLPGTSAYSMSKFAVRALADSLRREWQPSGIRVCLLNPGFVDSEIRKVTNAGVFKEEARDPIPRWLRVPTPIAAREMVRAILRGRNEKAITGHGKVIIAMARYCPWFLNFIIKFSAIRGRPQPKTST